MQFAISNSTCPLCRSPLSDNLAGLGPGTRLCDQCRTIVQEAFPGSARRLSGSAVVVEANGAMTAIPQDDPVSDLRFPEPQESFEDVSSYESFEYESQFPISAPSEPDSLEPDSLLMSDLPDDEDLNAKGHTEESELIDLAEDGSTQAQAQTLNHLIEPASGDTDATPAAEVEDHFEQQPPDILTEPVSNAPSLIDDDNEEPKPEQPAAIDPWEDPLPAWDYSQNEWPVLVGPPRRNRVGMLRASLVALLLLAAAGFYFFIFRPALRDRTSAPVNSEAAEPAPAAAELKSPEAKPAESGNRQEASSPSSQTPAVVDAKPAEVPLDGNAHGKFSLQAAAFPTQAGADEFIEKLRQAGVPSYVVSADLGRRGRWFRVRVGRFNTADDAQRFAAQAQLRAKAAGMSLQLIGCQYDQP